MFKINEQDDASENVAAANATKNIEDISINNAK